jgi:dihydrofolate reductase
VTTSKTARDAEFRTHAGSRGCEGIIAPVWIGGAMKASVFVGISVDGFMARKDGAIDFLPGDDCEPHGFEEFYASVDVVVIGRKAFEWVVDYGGWAYEKMRVVVLSSKPLDLSVARGRGGNVEQMSGDPAEIVAKLEASGVKHAYVDGGDTIQRFLRAGLIQRLTITRVPVLIGEGIPLFGALAGDIKLRHLSTQSYKSGLVKSEYEVIRARADAAGVPAGSGL